MNAWKYGLTVLVLFFSASFAVSLKRAYSKDAARIPDPAVDAVETGVRTAVLAGGCFWCTEAVFEQLKGVTEVVSGYAGGSEETAKYKLVSSGGTKPAEVIQIRYDPSKISYGQLLKVFFSVAHDPTQLNRQGPDWGAQYRSAIFPADAQQRRVAEAYVQQLGKATAYPQPLVTTLEDLEVFYPAEDYHQDYVKHHPLDPYVVVNARPKLEKLREVFPSLVKGSR